MARTQSFLAGAILLMLAGCAPGPNPLEDFVTAQNIEGLGTVSNDSDVKFGSNKLLFPNGSDGCNELVAPIVSGIADTASVVVEVDGEEASLVIQQAARFADESEAATLFEAVRINASGGLCDADAGIFIEPIYSHEPLTGLPGGAKGYTWLSEYFAEIAVSCEGDDSLVVRRQFWFVTHGTDFYVTAVEWSGCEGSEGIQNPVGWDRMLSSGLEAHQGQLAAIAG